MRHADLYPYGSSAYAVATYDKMATNMVALRAILGDAVFLRCYHAYGSGGGETSDALRFLEHLRLVLGTRSLLVLATWWFETWTLDQAIRSVEPDGAGLKVTIETGDWRRCRCGSP